MRRFLAFLLGVSLSGSSSVAAQQPTLVVENGRVIEGDGSVLESGSVVVEDGWLLSHSRSEGR